VSARPSRDRRPVSPQLDDADLEPLDLADVEDHTSYEHRRVVGAVPGQELEGVDLLHCRLESVELTSVRWRGIRMADVVIVDSDLSGAVFERAELRRVELRSCRQLGLHLPAVELHDVRFVGCRLDDSVLRSARGEHVVFEDCSMRGVDLRATELARSSFFGCDLDRAELHDARLVDGRFHGSEVGGLRGAASLRDLTIDSSQILPLALAMYSSLRIHVDDECGPGAP
jgi:uncharacterized protein YjbI with pentapeptide repeats